MNKLLILKKVSVVWRILVIFFMLFFFIAHIFFPDGPLPTLQEAILMLFFPLGVGLGLALSWKYPVKGSILTLLSMLLFYIGIFIKNNESPRGFIFLLLVIPAILELIYQKLTNRSKKKNT